MLRTVPVSGKQQQLRLRQNKLSLRVCGHFLTCVLSSNFLQTNSAYDPSRCFAFVHDLCDEDKSYPVPTDSLDIIILIFVLSSVVPDK